MWIEHQGKLIQVKDTTRHRYKTYIKAELLAELKALAAAHNTEVGYLIENGVMHLLEADDVVLQKRPRCAKKEFRTTIDKEVFDALSARAKTLGVPINRLIEEAVAYIDTATLKHKNYRYRIEKLSFL